MESKGDWSRNEAAGRRVFRQGCRTIVKSSFVMSCSSHTKVPSGVVLSARAVRHFRHAYALLTWCLIEQFDLHSNISTFIPSRHAPPVAHTSTDIYDRVAQTCRPADQNLDAAFGVV